MSNTLTALQKQYYSKMVQKELYFRVSALSLANMVDMPHGTTYHKPLIDFNTVQSYTKNTDITVQDNNTEDEKYNLITKQQPVVIVDMGPDVASLEDYENGLNGKENAIKTMDNCIDNLNESCIYSIMFFLIGFVLFSSIYVKI